VTCILLGGEALRDSNRDGNAAHNESAVGAASHERDVEIRYLPEERATQWWRYTSIMILESPEKLLFTMIVWTKGIAQLFPRCDYVLVQRDRKKPFGTKEEAALVPYDAVMASIGTYLDKYDQANGPVKYLRPDKMADVATATQNFTLTPIDLSTHTRVAADGFHDVALT